MASDTRLEKYELHVDTDFQKKARQPGGIPREEALRNVDEAIERLKQHHSDWPDTELEAVLRLLSQDRLAAPRDFRWIDDGMKHLRQIADVAATLDYPLLSFVARNLHLILAAIRQGAQYHEDVVSCYVDALLLARQRKYRHMSPESLPELAQGLSQVLDSPRLQPDETAD